MISNIAALPIMVANAMRSRRHNQTGSGFSIERFGSIRSFNHNRISEEEILFAIKTDNTRLIEKLKEEKYKLMSRKKDNL